MKSVLQNRLVLSSKAAAKGEHIVILDRDSGRICKHTIREEDLFSSLDPDLLICTKVCGGKDDVGRVLHHDLGIKTLATGKNVAVGGTLQQNTDAMILVTVIEGAACDRSVRVIGGLLPRIVDDKSDFIGVKQTCGKDVVSTVIDAAVKVARGMNIRKAMIFAVMRDMNTGPTVEHMAVGDGHGRADAVSRVHARDAAS